MRFDRVITLNNADVGKKREEKAFSNILIPLRLQSIFNIFLFSIKKCLTSVKHFDTFRLSKRESDTRKESLPKL